MSPLHWLLAAASLAGVVLNIRKCRACFLIWTATNASWCAVDAHAGLRAQAMLMVVYTGLAIGGYLAWRPVRPRPPA